MNCYFSTTMNQNPHRFFLLTLIAAALSAVSAFAAPAVLTASPKSALWLEGDSTLHPYHSSATVIAGEARFTDGEGRWMDRLDAKGLSALTVRVPVKDMRSGKNGLDKNLQEALRADRHPDITFSLSSYDLQASTAPESGARIIAQGILSVAGAEKPVTLTAAAREDGGLVFRGEKELLMTDFDVKPPKMFLGTVRTSNEVTVHFHLILEPQGSKTTD